jgi:predicted dehydrogenase
VPGTAHAITTLGAAVVGTGFIGRVHVEAVRRLGATIVGVLGSSPDRAQLAADELGVPRVYESYRELLEDPQVDVVHITSPNNVHFEQARDALLAGKHVVCEKPLANSSAETLELRNLACGSGLVHAVNYNARFYPQIVEARSRVAGGDLGELRLVTGSYRQDWLSQDTDWNWRIDSKTGGELRSVADIGSHLIDMLTFVTKRRVTHVMADLLTFMPVRQRPVGTVRTFGSSGEGAHELVDVASDDAATILVRFEGGARGMMAISQVSSGRKNSIEFEIAGSESSLSWNSESADELWIGHRHSPNQILTRDPSLLSPSAAAVATLPGGHVEGFENTFKALYRSVYSRIVDAGDGATERPHFAGFDDGHRDALVMDAILESAATSSWAAVAQEK